jgi:hypothetical protein
MEQTAPAQRLVASGTGTYVRISPHEKNKFI